MHDPTLYLLFADVVLTLHVAVVVFVVGGLVLVIAGNRFGWRWVNVLWFRLAHLASIGFVVAETWLGVICPLTTLENYLRSKAQGTTYNESFIEHWMQRLLFYDAPGWVFTVAYSLFGLAVVATWCKFPPTRR